MTYRFIFLICLLISMGCKSEKTTEKGIGKEEKKASSLKAELEFEIHAQLGEGAFWNHKTNEFYWIDIESKTLNIYNPETKTNKVFNTPSRVGTVVPVNENDVLVALEDGVYKLNVNTREIALFTDMKTELEGCRLNDGKCDPSGRFWVGSMHMQQEKEKANLYAISSTGELSKKLDRITISNGIVWTSNRKTMYYIDTPTSEIKAYDYNDETGAISNERVAVKIPLELGYPDGMAIDEEDKLWVGMWNGNAVIRFNPETGELLKKIEVPAHNVTSCAFGGDHLDVLYITTASLDMTQEEKQQYPLAGSVFKVHPGVKGVKSTFFKE
ncbi:SMP-30/gluconolactonase/LRE family protein [Seonamhaeicola marinus]|uniref:SMP-30/gluconolactonase/LRE family protein n=1 Tax=Seonamhaeicola marinus TaxID=1912246 RepID=A0A5D0HST7_9FLAO|nr:SMP-30/gluconolactonase/LRE family protein [Seonamhaeicola marinus]TYA74384.1 SMP-30/gluconolactonase/LRE family protein [Seonamhaeicola marinus]